MVLAADDNSAVFLLHATLMIPRVAIVPTLDEIQDILIIAGRYITSVSKGVGQWTGGKSKVSNLFFVAFLQRSYLKYSQVFTLYSCENLLWDLRYTYIQTQNAIIIIIRFFCQITSK